MNEAEFPIVRHVDYNEWLKIECNEEFDGQPMIVIMLGTTNERKRRRRRLAAAEDGEGACTCAGAGGGRPA